MKASTVIERLQTLMKSHGDLEVRIWNDTELEFDSANEIEPRRFLPTQRASETERNTVFYGVDPYALGDWDAQLRYDNEET